MENFPIIHLHRRFNDQIGNFFKSNQITMSEKIDLELIRYFVSKVMIIISYQLACYEIPCFWGHQTLKLAKIGHQYLILRTK